MWGVIGKVLERRKLRQGAMDRMSEAERTALIDGVMAEADALRLRNVAVSRELTAQLAGNSGRVVLSEQPDGLGCWYGRFEDVEGKGCRLDVLPPRSQWTGDMGIEEADPVDWLVMVDGEIVQRAASIDALAALGGGAR